MALEYLAGQILTAARLQKSVPNRLEQGTDHDIVSSTTLEETNLAVTVDGLIKVSLDVRYTSLAGGIVWDWAESGSLTMHARAIASPGDAASGDAADISSMRYRQITTFGENQDVPHFTTNTSVRLTEDLIVEGSGTMTFRFAQETSSGSATTVLAQSHIVWQYLGA